MSLLCTGYWRLPSKLTLSFFWPWMSERQEKQKLPMNLLIFKERGGRIWWNFFLPTTYIDIKKNGGWGFDKTILRIMINIQTTYELISFYFPAKELTSLKACYKLSCHCANINPDLNVGQQQNIEIWIHFYSLHDEKKTFSSSLMSVIYLAASILSVCSASAEGCLASAVRCSASAARCSASAAYDCLINSSD